MTTPLGGIRRVLSYKMAMARLAGDVATLVRLHSLGRDRGRNRRDRDDNDPTAVRLRPLGGCRVYCRRGTSDIAVLWEVFVDRDYFIPEPLIGPVRTVLDLGANVGYSMLYFARCYPLARVVGVEPDRGNVELAAMNLESAGMEGRCSIIKAAAWDHDAMIILDRTGSEYSYRVAGETAGSTGDAPAYSVAKLIDLAGFKHVDLLKIDVEGAEDRLLAAASEWAGCVSSVICELHGGMCFNDFRDIMARHGFVSTAPGPESGLKLPFARRSRSERS